MRLALMATYKDLAFLNVQGKGVTEFVFCLKVSP